MGLHLITLLPLTLPAQSDSDIPVVGKGWRKRGRTFKGGNASTSYDDSSDFQEKKRHKPQTKDCHHPKGCPFQAAGLAHRGGWLGTYRSTIPAYLEAKMTSDPHCNESEASNHNCQNRKKAHTANSTGTDGLRGDKMSVAHAAFHSLL